MFEKIKMWYLKGLWTETMVQNAVTKGVLTAEEAAQIINQNNIEVIRNETD